MDIIGWLISCCTRNRNTNKVSCEPYNISIIILELYNTVMKVGSNEMMSKVEIGINVIEYHI